MKKVIDGLICKGILTLADFHTIISELTKLAYEKWERAGKPDGKDKEFWDEAEKDYFRYHFVGDTDGLQRTKFGLNQNVADWK